MSISAQLLMEYPRSSGWFPRFMSFAASLLTILRKIKKTSGEEENGHDDGERRAGAGLDSGWFSRFMGFAAWLVTRKTKKTSGKEENDDGESRAGPGVDSGWFPRFMGFAVSSTRKIKKTSGEEKNDHGRWADAEIDILILVKERLNFLDQIHFGAVCDGWRSVPFTSSVGLPWIVGLKQNARMGFCICGTYDPLSKKSFKFEHEVIKPHIDQFYHLPIVLGSKNGWIFLVDVAINTGECEAMVIRVINRETIHLPRLYIKNVSRYRTANGTFSTLPTCSDCVYFFIPNTFRFSDEILLFSCVHTDEGWTAISLSTGPRLLWLEDVICLENMLYFMFQHGETWTFNFSNQNWGRFPVDCSQVLTEVPDKMYLSRLVKFHGELLFVRFEISNPKGYTVYKLNLAFPAWIQQNGLINMGFFMTDISNGSYAISAASDFNAEAMTILGNQVYSFNVYNGEARHFFFLQHKGSCGNRRVRFDLIRRLMQRPGRGSNDTEKCGYCLFLPKYTDSRIWAEPA